MILRAMARIASNSRLHASATGNRDAESGLTDRLRHQANSEHGLLGLVQQFHMPFAVLLQAAGNAAKQVAAHLGHLGPGVFTALKFRSVVGSARIATTADPEKIQCYHHVKLSTRMTTAQRCGR